MSEAIEIIAGMAGIADRFKVAVFDLWGCLHDGAQIYERALQCLVELRKRNIRAIVMSNAPRRSAIVATKIADLGITPDLYDRLSASGEVTWQALRHRRIPEIAAARHVFAIMAEQDGSILDGLEFERTMDMARADFILAIGVNGPQAKLDQFESELHIAKERGLTMVCANPDLLVHRAGIEELCAGSIARFYEEQGGRVVWFGKPYPAIYQSALREYGVLPSEILCIGDSLRTDVAGGKGYGAATLFIGGGIHYRDVLTGDRLDEGALRDLCDAARISPDFAMPYLAW